MAAVVWATIPAQDDPPPASDRPFPELPRLVHAPAEPPPPPLPSDRAMGEAALVYQCRGCPIHLVLPDGTQYRLDGYVDRDGGRQVALSPDGRWLGLEVATGELTPVTGDHSGPLGLSPQILDSGDLAIVDEQATADNRLVVRIVDPATGRLRRQLEIDIRPALGPGERTTIRAGPGPDRGRVADGPGPGHPGGVRVPYAGLPRWQISRTAFRAATGTGAWSGLPTCWR